MKDEQQEIRTINAPNRAHRVETPHPARYSPRLSTDRVQRRFSVPARRNESGPLWGLWGSCEACIDKLGLVGTKRRDYGKQDVRLDASFGNGGKDQHARCGVWLVGGDVIIFDFGGCEGEDERWGRDEGRMKEGWEEVGGKK